MVNNKRNYQMGKDVNRNWNLKNGDIEICSYEDNIHQAILNRLNCPLGALQIFYTDYGSTVKENLGEINNETIREYIRLEIEKRLKYDPRFKNVTCEVNHVNSKEINCNINVTFANDETYEDNYVIGISDLVNIGEKQEVMIITPLISAQIKNEEIFNYPIKILTKNGDPIHNLEVTIKIRLYDTIEWTEELITDETGTVYVNCSVGGDYNINVNTTETDSFYHNSSSVQLILLGD